MTLIHSEGAGSPEGRNANVLKVEKVFSLNQSEKGQM